MAAPNSSSSSSELPDLLSNVHNLVPFKLEKENFFAWRYVIITTLKAYNLFGYLDGSLECPEKFVRVRNDDEGESSSTTTAQINPSYEIWCREDLRVMLFINATLSADALWGMRLNCPTTTRQLWIQLCEATHISKKMSFVHNDVPFLESIKAGLEGCGMRPPP
ncbi:hypothetical protein ABKV19_005117 [Rosa sericea]